MRSCTLNTRDCDYSYNIRKKPVKVVNEASDLGIIISSDLKYTKHSKPSFENPETMQGFIARNYKYLTPGSHVFVVSLVGKISPRVFGPLIFSGDKKDFELLQLNTKRRATEIMLPLGAQPFEELHNFSLHWKRDN